MRSESYERARRSPLLPLSGEISDSEKSISQRMGKRRLATTASRHQGRGAYSYARIICAAAVAHGVFYRGPTLAVAAPLGRPAASTLVEAAAAGEVGGGSATWSSGGGPDRALFEAPRGGGSRDGGGGVDRDAHSTAAEAMLHT